jgi:uncharacterized membrane protein YkvA (DUF1232 family)
MTADQRPPDAPDTPLRELLARARLAWQLFTDRQVPLANKIIPAAAVLYVLSPVDLLPDLVPGLGQMDDLAIVLLALKLFIDAAPAEARRRHEGGDDTVTTTYRVQDDH